MGGICELGSACSARGNSSETRVIAGPGPPGRLAADGGVPLTTRYISLLRLLTHTRGHRSTTFFQRGNSVPMHQIRLFLRSSSGINLPPQRQPASRSKRFSASATQRSRVSKLAGRWLAEREQEERKRRRSVYSRSAREKKVRGKSYRLHFSHVHSTRCYLIDISRCSALNSLQEDHAYLSDKYNALYHTTSQKLAARATELTTCERQVESLTAELYDEHEAAVSQSAEVLRLRFALDAHEAEEAS